MCGPGLNVALAFRAFMAEQNRTSTLDLVHALAALNKSTYYECEITSWCDQDEEFIKVLHPHFSTESTKHILK